MSARDESSTWALSQVLYTAFECLRSQTIIRIQKNKEFSLAFTNAGISGCGQTLDSPAGCSEPLGNVKQRRWCHPVTHHQRR
jgi:hypothetical protein